MLHRGDLVLCALLACGQTAEPEPIREVQTEQIESAPELEPSPPPRPEVAISVATMSDGSVSKCEDLTIRLALPPEKLASDGLPEALAEVRTRFLEGLNLRDSQFALSAGQSCSSQFADRQAFGTCTQPERALDDDGRAFISGVISIYSADRVFASDEEMRQCIEEGASWQAMPRDSDEARRALRRDRADDLLRQSRALQKQLR